jgi:tRNA nucleotidyltransferase (CCA-adding enzyme)
MSFRRDFRRALPPVTHEILQAVGMVSARLGYRCFLVGGIARDLVIGYSNLDLDITVEGDAARLGRELAARTGSVFKGPTRFGTCKVESRAFGTIDLAAARTEKYPRPGALPEVEPAGLAEDLGRRDFTLNAMAVSINPGDYGTLIDPHAGLADIERKRLAVLHDDSFRDDPTRILRGIRFAVRYGFRFDRHTLNLLRRAVRRGMMSNLSGKRVYSELRLLAKEEKAPAGVRMLDDYGIPPAVHRDLALDAGRRRHLRKLGPALRSVTAASGPGGIEPWIPWFSVFWVGLQRPAAERLITYFNLPSPVRSICRWTATGLGTAARRLGRLDRKNPYGVRRLLDGVPVEGLVHLWALTAARERRLIGRYLRHWRHVRPRLTGGEIASMGVGEGPEVGRILDRLLRLRLEGKVRTRSDELAHLS